jgi:hypothetical protein
VQKSIYIFQPQANTIYVIKCLLYTSDIKNIVTQLLISDDFALMLIYTRCIELLAVSENWNAWNGRSDEMDNQQNEYEPHCEDPDFNAS